MKERNHSNVIIVIQLFLKKEIWIYILYSGLWTLKSKFQPWNLFWSTNWNINWRDKCWKKTCFAPYLISQKGLFNFSPNCIVDGDFLLPNEIKSWNFQQMLDLGFYESAQNFSFFRQFFFIVSKGGPKEKNSKIYFSAFFLWKLWKKVV